MKRTTMAALMFAAGLASGPASAAPYSAAESREYRNYTPYAVSFYERLLAGRVFVFESPGKDRSYNDVPLALIFSEDGRWLRCAALKAGGHLSWIGTEPARWSIEWKRHGATVRYDPREGKPRFARFFYEPETGATHIEVVLKDGEGRVTSWIRPNSGWIQDTLPRSIADVCPNLRLPAGLKINEKQTSRKFNDLRRQDPDAPIRNFPGSHLTGPGRTGLAASRLAPTTTKKEVWAFLDAQEGNVMLGPKGNGRVFVRGAEGTGRHEIWGLKDEGDFAWIADMVEAEDGKGEWLHWEFDGKVVARYPMGYPLPYLPTGLRHAAFQLTDKLIEAGAPVALPWMPAAWKDFTFRADGTVRARQADGGPDVIASWRWTQGKLWVKAGNNQEAPGWEDVADALGMEKPALWTRSDGPGLETASTGSATSGTARCAGGYEGTATWTLGEGDKKVWDTSGCRKAD